MQEVYDRVKAWNETRYERIYDHELTMELLHEEYKEYMDAESDVNCADALADIVFVCFGGIWKLNQDTASAAKRASVVAEILLSAEELPPILYMSSFLAAGYVTEYQPMSMLWNIIHLCLSQLNCMGLPKEGIKEVLLAICDSNDTKLEAKILSNSKYSSEGKGHNYVSPKLNLTNILRSYKCRLD